MDIEKLRKDLLENSDPDGPCIEDDLMQAAATALSTIPTLQAELEQVKRERDAAQALLEERIGVRGTAPITTVFGLPLDRLRELAQADRLIGKEVWAQAKHLSSFKTKQNFIQRRTIQYVSLLKGRDILCHIQTGAFPLNEIGRTFFLICAEAEAALRGEQEEGGDG